MYRMAAALFALCGLVLAGSSLRSRFEQPGTRSRRRTRTLDPGTGSERSPRPHPRDRSTGTSALHRPRPEARSPSTGARVPPQRSGSRCSNRLVRRGRGSLHGVRSRLRRIRAGRAPEHSVSRAGDGARARELAGLDVLHRRQRLGERLLRRELRAHERAEYWTGAVASRWSSRRRQTARRTFSSTRP